MNLYTYYFRGKEFYMDVSDELLDMSYPNRNYDQIAKSLLTYELDDLERKGGDLVSSFLESYNLIYFHLSHSNFSSKNWRVFTSYRKDKSIEELLEERYEEIGFDAAILKTCNRGDWNIYSSRFPILQPLTSVGIPHKYSRNDLRMIFP